jgi:hypothetical protein
MANGHGGPRPGFVKPKGVLNKRTQYAIQQAEKQYAEQKAQGHLRATEVLDKLMHLHMGAAAVAMPTSPKAIAEGKAQPNPYANDEVFRFHARRAAECAVNLAPYQQPQFRSIMIQAPPPEITDERSVAEKLIEFFDNLAESAKVARGGVKAAAAPRRAGPLIEGTLVDE